MTLADITTSLIVTDLLPKYICYLHHPYIKDISLHGPGSSMTALVSAIVSLLDIDECEEGTHNCFSEDKCSNSLGSFSCRTGHPGNAPEEEEDSFVGKCNYFTCSCYIGTT